MAMMTHAYALCPTPFPAATTGEPVSWYFHTMEARFDTIYYAPGAQVPDESFFTPP